MFADKHFLVWARYSRIPRCGAGVLRVVINDRLGAIGVWSSARVAEYSGVKDPQFLD